MFALLDLAFEPSRACHGGGYSAVRGRYSKRHSLLAMPLFVMDMGDPIYVSTDPFELMHKLKTRPTLHNSLKHAATVARSILVKVRGAQMPFLAVAPMSYALPLQDIVDRVFAILVPQAFGLPLVPLAPLDATPLLRKLSSPLAPAANPRATLGAARYADLLLAWGAARGDGVVPDEPFDPSRARMFNVLTLSGGECRGSNDVVLWVQSACEVPWGGAGDAWQPQPDADSDNDSVGDDVITGGVSVFQARAWSRPWPRKRTWARKRPRESIHRGTGCFRVCCQGASSSDSDDDEEEEGYRRRRPQRGRAGRGRGGRGRGGSNPSTRATQTYTAASSSDGAEADLRDESPHGSSTDTGFSSHSPTALDLPRVPVATHHRQRVTGASIMAALTAT